jgi:alkanesulfonate monooxygenase SsuD/methylene tetrahydromethanopterin reductase-like flavin-dependent oxidoreductase (luciferase family)
MKIGMTLPTMVPGIGRREILEWSRRIDAGPYSTLAAGERITFPNQEILVSLAAAAALTERVRIAFTVVVLPLHSAAVMAKQVATLDVLSGGRVSLAVGVGGREEDYRAVGASFEKRASRMASQVAAMRRMWAGEPPFDGAAPIGPPPVQPGGPEVLVGALAPDGIRRAARWADGLSGFSFAPDASEIATAFETARREWQAAGRAVLPRLVTSFWFALGAGGRDAMGLYVKRYLGVFGAAVAAGLAEQCRAVDARAFRGAVREIADTGADELILVPTTADPDEVERVADLLG